MAIEDLSTTQGWEAFKARHGGELGRGVLGTSTDDAGHRLADPFFKYTMQDGTTIEINGAGQVNAIDEKGPSVATGTAQPTTSQTAPSHIPYTITNADGSTDTYQYQWNPQTKAWEKSTDIPPEHKPAPAGATANKPPSDPGTWLPIRANPSDPNSRVIALQDPTNSSNRVSVPEGAQPQKPSIVQGPQGSVYSWDGSSLKNLLPATPDKRQIVQGQGGSLYAWDGQNLSVLQAGSQPKEGDTRPAIQQGRTTTQEYHGGDWVTTSIGASAIPGAPKEGDTRPAIQNGYNTTQTYQGGDWTTTSIGSRATPATPTVVNTPSTEPYITTMTDGQISTQLNPGFIAKTQTDVAARVGQLQSAALAQRDQLTQQVSSGVLTQDQATQKFNQWWSATVEPQKAALQVAQQQANLEQQKTQQDLARQNLQAVSPQVNAILQATSGEHRVGPGFGAVNANLAQSFATGKFPQAPTAEQLQSAFVTPAPDYSAIAQQATAEALKHISPTAAQIATGQPIPTGGLPTTDITSGLNRTNFQFGPTPTPVPGPAQQQTSMPAPAPTPPQVDWAALQQRLQADQAAQQIQAQVQFPGPTQTYVPPGGSSYSYPTSPWSYVPGPYQPAF